MTGEERAAVLFDYALARARDMRAGRITPAEARHRVERFRAALESQNGRG